jgi:hypothetical protein
MMVSMMAMDEHWTGKRVGRFDDSHGLLSGDTIIADRHMNVAESKAVRGFDVRTRTIDADDGLHAEILQRREAVRPLGLTTAIETGAQPKGVLDTRDAYTLQRVCRLFAFGTGWGVLLIRRQ